MSIGVMRTFSGRMVDVVKPEASSICIEDIAHHLSIIGRWGGASRRHYSVAEHSCWVSWMAEEILQGAGVHGLLHDAHEAYVGDIITPLKKLIAPSRKELRARLVDRFFDDTNIECPGAAADVVMGALPPDYNEICDGLDWAIYRALGVDPPTPAQAEAVHLADQFAAWVEAQCLTKHPEQCRWTTKPPDGFREPRLMLQQIPEGCTPDMAEHKFLEIWAHHIKKNSA